MEPQCISGVSMRHPFSTTSFPTTNMDTIQAKWSMCVPMSISIILLLVGGISMLTGYDHVRAANIVSFSGCMLVFFLFIFIVRKTCFEQKSTVKKIMDPAPAYQKKWRKEYYSNLQESCTTELDPRDELQVHELNQRDMEEGLEAVHIPQTVDKSHSDDPVSVKLKKSTLEFQNYGFKEVNINVNSSSNEPSANVDKTFDLPSYDQAMAYEINTSPCT